MVQALCRPNGASPYSRSGSTKAKLAVPSLIVRHVLESVLPAREKARYRPSSKIVGGNPRPSLLSRLRPVLCAPKSALPARSFCVFVHCQCAICDLKFTVSFATNPDSIKQADVDRL